MQVIHLTVKDFLSARRDGSSTHSDLLIDHASSSLQLTMVCLQCIKIHCSKPIADLECGSARIDMELNQNAVAERQRQVPLLEYAVISWLAHFTDCEDASSPRIMQAFRETFESTSTFVWVEVCMTLQAGSIQRLLAGLDELADRCLEMKYRHCHADLGANDFSVHWPSAMHKLLKNYNVILLQRPWEVHLLDLQDCFDKLTHYYDKYGRMTSRETTRRLEEQQCSCSRPAKPLPLLLSADMQERRSPQVNIFLLHDECRNVFFSGGDKIENRKQYLYVHHADTGRHLP